MNKVTGIFSLALLAVVLYLNAKTIQTPLPEGWEMTLVSPGEQYVEAIGFYDQLLRMHPDSAEVLAARSRAYLKISDWPKALEDSFSASKIDANNLEAMRVRTRAYYRLGQYAKALEEANKLALHKNAGARDQAMRALILAYDNRFAEAWTEAQSAIAKEPNCADAYVAMALVHLSKNQLKETVSDIRIAQDIDPSNSRSYLILAMVQLQRKEYSKAATSCSDAIWRETILAEAFKLRSHARRELQDYKGSVWDATMALGLAKPNERSAIYTERATTLLKVRRFDRAMADCEQALLLAPASEEAKQLRERILKEETQEESARESDKTEINQQENMESKGNTR